ncbi:electron transport complex subunit RsxG [Thorsellia anophelis]|uniref:Ion-translocating oxidoreductase complex subunit G n=1 Tax=Thorsellia anophelis DSM 18579 TaxID=1123402 RepID=A0A1I0CTQ5_9GAMM|nr:electron transport complex subunit RsxG [Thorsellia anophelis]SET22922.1 electron transport complex protein RnfG [Thorsellia anophelis DSM 18579]
MFELIRKHAITLAIFAALTTAATAIVYQLTKDTILAQTHQERLSLLSEVLPKEMQSPRLLSTCVQYTDDRLGKMAKPVYSVIQDGKRIAAVIEATAPDGYSGAIRLLVAAKIDGTVLGVRTLEHRETPGLGDKIELRISNWITKFTGLQVKGSDDPSWAVKADGGQFDQFAGATITPRAVVNAVKRATLVIQSLPSDLSNLPTCGY